MHVPLTSVADPDPHPMDPHHFAEIFSTDPDPDLNLDHLPHPSPTPSHLISPPSDLLPPPSPSSSSAPHSLSLIPHLLPVSPGPSAHVSHPSPLTK